MTSKFPPGVEQDANNLAIDFDGVIHNFDKGYHDGTCYGDPIPGSLEALKNLSSKYKIIIFTAKSIAKLLASCSKPGGNLLVIFLYG